MPGSTKFFTSSIKHLVFFFKLHSSINSKANSTIPLISIDDYEVAHADGPEGASVDGETAAVDNINPFSDVSIAEWNILE
nr:hypothetical protein [Tanacetum cinerariifolium]